LHTAEGALTYQSLGSYFSNPASGVSSHVGIDDTPNTVGEYVARNMKAWTAANANPVAVQAELCAFAAWSAPEWQAHANMLANAAQWIREEASTFGIPLVRLTPQQAQSNGRGICQHSDLGSWGGNHSDCGPAFPIDQVISMAGGNAPSPVPPTSRGMDNMILTDPVSGGVWVCDPNSSPPGAVYSYDGAPYCGGTNNTKMNSGKFPCVGIDVNPDKRGGGYVLVLDFGDQGGGLDRYRRYRFPRDGSGKA
jgi:hypothetical protein